MIFSPGLPKIPNRSATKTRYDSNLVVFFCVKYAAIRNHKFVKHAYVYACEIWTLNWINHNDQKQDLV